MTDEEIFDLQMQLVHIHADLEACMTLLELASEATLQSVKNTLTELHRELGEFIERIPQ